MHYFKQRREPTIVVKKNGKIENLEGLCLAEFGLQP